MNKRLLIVDDELNTLAGLEKFLRGRFDVTAVPSGDEAIELLKNNDYDLVLTDLKMPGAGGMSVLEATLSKAKTTPCIVFTAYGTVENAVSAIKAGAADFVTKPVKLPDLEQVIDKVLGKAQTDGGKLPAKASEFKGMIIGSSQAMTEIIRKVQKIAPSRATVLISGESGTGKEVIARLIHDLSGRVGLFVPIHCAALPANLLESELFGHEKGAFTGAVELRKGRFELADKGTILLDEIGEIDSSIQIKLLRVLETKTIERIGSSEPIVVDARLIAATNRDLKALVEEGKFREDLFYRLNVVQLHLPPLRERKEDIAELANHFMREAALENGSEVDSISPDAMRLLTDYRWPGNIRELKNCIERMVVMSSGSTLSVTDVPDEIKNFPLLAVGQVIASSSDTLRHNERVQIEKTLADCGGNRTKAAAKLGISRRTLLRRLKEYDIS